MSTCVANADKNFVSVADKSCLVTRRATCLDRLLFSRDCLCAFVYVRGAKTLSLETGESRLFRRSAIAYVLNRLLSLVSHLLVSGRCVTLSLSEVVSLLGLADDDEVLAGTSEENRKRALWQFYSTGMLTHSHSDGEFPIYSQGECRIYNFYGILNE